MTPAEKKFKDAVRKLMRAGVHPTPTKIKQIIGFFGKPNNLNSQQCGWLRKDLRVTAIRKTALYYAPCSWACCNKGGLLPEVK